MALRFLLKGIVTDFGSSIHGGFNVTSLQRLTGFMRFFGPQTSEAIGLQLKADTQGVVFPLADTAPHAVNFVRNAEQILNMVAHFVPVHPPAIPIGQAQAAG